MNICFITAGPIEWASSRMRAHWVAEALDERGHDCYIYRASDKIPGDPEMFDAFIWQKTVNLELIRKLPDARHYWDVCDPSWWWQPNECREIAQHMTGVVASSEALADDFNEWANGINIRGMYRWPDVHTIPDRLKLSHFHTQRQHGDVSPVRLIWFGIAANRVALWGAKANLERLVANGHKIELTVFDERPDIPFRFSDAFPIYHVKWSLSKEVEVLASHDIALLPPYPGAWGEVKSDNKAITAGGCGLPVTAGMEYAAMEYLATSPQTRKNTGNRFRRMANERDVAQSAAEWEALLS